MTSSNASEETEWVFSLSNSGKSAIFAIVISVLGILAGYNGYSVTKDPSFCLPPEVPKEHYLECHNLQAWFPDLFYALTPIIGFGLAFLVFRTLLFSGPDEPETTSKNKSIQSTACPNCGSALNGMAWCGNKKCIEFWREKYV